MENESTTERKAFRNPTFEAIACASIPIVLWAGGMTPYIYESFKEGDQFRIVNSILGTAVMGGLSYISYRERIKYRE
jgi:hypothetical protein